MFGWYDEIVDAWADEGPAFGLLTAFIACAFGALMVAVGVFVVIGLIAGLPWTLLIIPIGWGFLVFARTVARDATRRKVDR